MKALLMAAALALSAPVAAHARTGADQPSHFGRVPFSPTPVADTVALSAVTARMVNGRTEGMVCDGLTDDSAKLNTALTRAQSSDAKAVFIPPSASPCMLGSYVVVPAGVTIYAVPNSVSIEARAGNAPSGSAPLLFELQGNTTLYGLVLDGGGPTFSSSPNSMVVVYGGRTPRDNILIDNVTFRDSRGTASLASTSITRMRIVKSRFTNIGNMWKTTGLITDRRAAIAFCCGSAANNHGNSVVDSYFEDIGLDAISADVQTDFMVSGSHFRMENGQTTFAWTGTAPSALSAAIYYTETVARGSAIGNTIDGASGNGIDAVSAWTHISGNRITNSGQAGIGCFALSTPPDRVCTITGNTVINSGLWPSNGHRGGITVGYYGGAVTYAALTISGNTVVDQRGSPTQRYGLWGWAGATVRWRWIDSNNVLTGSTATIGGALSGLDAFGAAGSIVGTSGTITKVPGATTLDLYLVEAGVSAGVPITCGAGASCGGPGGGGAGGAYRVIRILWSTLGVSSCSVVAPAGVTPGGAAAATTVTCGSTVYQARAGGRGQAGVSGAATGGGSSSAGVAGTGGNAAGPSGGASGAGCNGGVAAAGTTGGADNVCDGVGTAGTSGSGGAGAVYYRQS
jgi:hypothetical protein